MVIESVELEQWRLGGNYREISRGEDGGFPKMTFRISDASKEEGIPAGRLVRKQVGERESELKEIESRDFEQRNERMTRG